MFFPYGYQPPSSESTEQQWIPLGDGNFVQQPHASWTNQFQTEGRMPQVYLQNPNDLQPFVGKWGIFTINGQRIVAYVDSIDAASRSMRVYYPNNQTGVIDITMISMAEGPFVTMPGGPGPGPGPGPDPGPGPGRCRWMWIPVVGWQYICL